MKKLSVFLVALLFLGVTFAASQPVPGKKFEFSTGFSFTSFKISDSTESTTLLSLPLRFGYFVWKGLSIEPELMLMKFDEGDTAYNLSGNLCYNFKTSGQFVPFVLAGAGFGNGVAFGPFVEGGSDVNATLLNFGGGVKYVVGTSGAIRLEYRFTRNRLSGDETDAVNANIHQVFVGLSLFF